MEENSGVSRSPSSLYRCVEVDPKQFSKEVPVPVAGSSSANLWSFSPRFLPGPSVFSRVCQLPSGATLSCGHRGASLLPLVRIKSFPLLFGSEGKVFRGGPDVVPSLASSWVSSPSLDFEGVDCVVFESVGSGTKLPGFIPSSVIYQLHGLGQVPWPC